MGRNGGTGRETDTQTESQLINVAGGFGPRNENNDMKGRQIRFQFLVNVPYVQLWGGDQRAGQAILSFVGLPVGGEWETILI